MEKSNPTVPKMNWFELRRQAQEMEEKNRMERSKIAAIRRSSGHPIEFGQVVLEELRRQGVGR